MINELSENFLNYPIW